MDGPRLGAIGMTPSRLCARYAGNGEAPVLVAPDILFIPRKNRPMEYSWLLIVGAGRPWNQWTRHAR